MSVASTGAWGGGGCDTTFAGQSVPLQVSWTDLADAASGAHAGVGTVSPSRTIRSAHSMGRLTNVPEVGLGSCSGGTPSANLDYHPNTMIETVTYGNGLVDA